MIAILATIGICLFSATADYFLKRASEQSSPLLTIWFALGFGMYACTAFGWVFVMRRLQFATLGVVYASTMVILMAAIALRISSESPCCVPTLNLTFDPAVVLVGAGVRAT